MGWYEDKVLPRVIDFVMDTGPMRTLRTRAAEPLTGTVLEIGFGSGLNLPHYPEAVEQVLAVDPAMLGRTLAADRLAHASLDVDFVGLDG